MRKYVMVVLLLASLCAGSILNIEACSVQREIAKEVIRLHVLADSDSEEDQAVKRKVRDRVMEYLETKLADVDSVEEAREVIQSSLDSIADVSCRELKKQGQSVTAVAELEKVWFPEKTYGDCTFPAGVYEALQVKIGSAQGTNWWCVLYPGLCFEYSLRGVAAEKGKETLHYVLTEDEMETILNDGKVKVRFRWF